MPKYVQAPQKPIKKPFDKRLIGVAVPLVAGSFWMIGSLVFSIISVATGVGSFSIFAVLLTILSMASYVFALLWARRIRHGGKS